MEIWIAIVVFAFVSSLIWLIKNWNASGPTDFWSDGDFEKRKRRPAKIRDPERPDPHAAQLIEIGYWPTVIDADRPSPAAFVDADWSDEERRLVLRHLTNGIPMPWDGGPVEWCVFCRSVLAVEELTDGTYVWPTHLTHYVSEHDVRLPGLFVLHVQRAQAPIGLPPGQEFVETGPRDSGWWNSLAGP